MASDLCSCGYPAGKYPLGECPLCRAVPQPSGDANSDLATRCHELMRWWETGIYNGEALASLAEQFTDYGDEALRRAEQKTGREAVARAAIAALPAADAGVREAVLEEAARVADKFAPETSGPDYGMASDEERAVRRSEARVAYAIAKRIRALRTGGGAS